MRSTWLALAFTETNAGGVGLCILNGVCYLPRNDLTIKLPGRENLWVELTSQNDPKGIIIGVIYRHSFCSISDFQYELSARLLDLSNTTYYICGDININLLNLEASPQINEYTNLLWSAGAKPVAILRGGLGGPE